MSAPWRKIQNEIREFENVVVAVSGGADSMFAWDFVRRSGVKHTIAHFDHKMRDDSMNDRHFVVDRSLQLGCYKDCYVGYGENINNEEDARNQRYAFLKKIMEGVGANRVITGHHFNDQMETIILRLSRGYPHNNLMMKKDNGFVFRPFLDIEQEVILKQVRYLGLEYIVDPSNATDDFERNRVRHHVIPELMKTRNVVRAMRRGINKTKWNNENESK